jgi:hypothetical protein
MTPAAVSTAMASPLQPAWSARATTTERRFIAGIAQSRKYSNDFASSALLSVSGIQRRPNMRLIILSAAIAATVLGAIPASAEVVIRAGESGVAIGERDHDRDGMRHREEWRNHRAECRTVRERIETPSGRIIIKTRRTC